MTGTAARLDHGRTAARANSSTLVLTVDPISRRIRKLTVLPIIPMSVSINHLPRLASGAMVGSYRIERLIGVGGMGEVYRARDTKLERDVALKILPDSFTRDPDRLARFEREAQVLASLNHPNIAAIYGVEEADGVQRARAGTGRRTDAGRPHRPRTACRSTKRCRSRSRSPTRSKRRTRKGIVHRDLKPANIKSRPTAR